MSNKTTDSGVIPGALGIAFIVLKLVGVIGWPWWLVLAPFWAGLALVLAILAIAGVTYGLIKVFQT